MNIFDTLERSKLCFGDKEALWFKGRSYSFNRLHAEASQLAGALAEMGLKEGDRICLFLPNIPEFVISYYGVAKLGGVNVSVNSMLKREELAYLFNDVNASAVITHSALAAQLPPPAETPTVKTIICAGEGGLDDPRAVSFDQAKAKAKPLPKAADVDREAVASILYTSGTTGRQKGAMLTHANLTFNILAAIHSSRMEPSDVQLCYLPLFHVFGQNYVMTSSLAAGSKLVLHERFDVGEVVSSIGQNSVTVFYGVPTVYIRLLTLPDIPKRFKSVRYFFSAAATMPQEIARNWKEASGLPIYEGYGLTETSPFASYNHEFLYKSGSVGTPLINVDMKVFDEEDNELPVGQIGEICIKGPNVMKGYYNRPEETAQAIKKGWFHSGDVGTMDGDGYFYIVDRVKDMINSAGFKIWPREVEEVLFQHPAVHEVAIVGVPDAEFGEAVKAFIVLKPGAVTSEQEIVRYCRDRIAVYKAPKYAEFIEALPKNPTGKILKKDLRGKAAPAAG